MSESIHFVGRFEHQPDEGARFAWSGSAISVRFRGTTLNVELTDSGQNLFTVLVDGVVYGDRRRTVRGRQHLNLARELGPSEHTLTLYRRTEAFCGESVFHGFHAPDGELLPWREGNGRRLELIGDSISAGYGNEGTRHDSFVPDTENHYLSYGAIAARALDAELTTLAWSGKGVFDNAGDPRDTLTMPALWRRTLPERQGSRWDVAHSPPDAVLLNLGTNDLSPNNPDHSPFEASYRDFLRELRAAYGKAHVLCLLGPCLTGKTLDHARTAMQAAIRFQEDARVTMLEFAPIGRDEGHGADAHPSLRTHARMGQALTEALSAQLGWIPRV